MEDIDYHESFVRNSMVFAFRRETTIRWKIAKDIKRPS